MKRFMRVPALACSIVAACTMAPLTSIPQNHACAQGRIVYGPTGSYYSGYGRVHSGNGLGYGSMYRRGANGYSGLGNGPYVYGSDNTYVYPSDFGSTYGSRSYHREYNYFSGPRYYGRSGLSARVYNPYVYTE